MDRDNGFGFRSDCGFNKGWIYIISLLININKYWCGSAETDRFGSGNKGAWSGDNFISLADIQANQASSRLYELLSGEGGPRKGGPAGD